MIWWIVGIIAAFAVGVVVGFWLASRVVGGALGRGLGW